MHSAHELCPVTGLVTRKLTMSKTIYQSLNCLADDQDGCNGHDDSTDNDRDCFQARPPHWKLQATIT